MAHITLTDALEKIQSDKLKIRDEGIAELKHVLKANETASGPKRFNDKTWHTLFEVLFRTVTKERSNFLRATKGNVRSHTASRLSACASVFRFAVSLAIPNLRLKSLKALVGHILHTLPVSDGKFCEPLSLDYLKALLAILSHEPHLEHLPQDDWRATVELCLDGVQCSLGTNDSVLDPHVGPISPNDSNSGSVLRTSLRGRSPRPRSIPSSVSNLHVSCLLQCLTRLTSVASFPILNVSGHIFETLFDYLRSIGSAHGTADAFCVINNCLQSTLTDSTSVTADVIREAIPVIRDQWAKSDFKTRDEMLCCFVQCQSHLQQLICQQDSSDLSLDLDGLYECLVNDYFHLERRGHSHLQLDELRLATTDGLATAIGAMRTDCFSLRKSTTGTEHNWTVLHFISFVACLLDQEQVTSTRDSRLDKLEKTSKRRKISLKLEDLLSQCTHGSESDRVNAVQIAVFMLDRCYLNESRLLHVVEQLTNSLESSSPAVSSWSMLGLSSLALQKGPTDSSLKKIWLDTWHKAFRLISSSLQSRAACHLSSVLIVTQQLRYSDISPSIAGLIESTGLRGPAFISDASLSLWVTIVELVATNQPGDSSNKGFEAALDVLDNKVYAAQVTQAAQARDFVRLLAFSEETVISGPPLKFQRLEKLGRFWLQHSELRPLKDYLLLINGPSDLPVTKSRPPAEPEKSLSRFRGTARASAMIFDLLWSEMELLAEAWRSMTEDTARGVHVSSLCLAFQLCLVAGLSLPNSPDARTDRQEELMTNCCVQTANILSYTRDISIGQVGLSELLEMIACVLPDTIVVGESDNTVAAPTFLRKSSPAFCKTLDSRRRLEEDSLHYQTFEDSMSGLDADSQQSLGPIAGTAFSSRSRTKALLSPTAFERSVACYLYFLASVEEAAGIGQAVDHGIPESFVDKLITLPALELLLSQTFLDLLFSSRLGMEHSSLEVLLDHVAETYLAIYDDERCEASICFCVNLLESFVSSWTQEAPESLSLSGKQVYCWVIEKALRPEIASPGIKASVSDLLFVLLREKMDYAPENIRSPRTILFGLLQTGEIQIQHHIALRLPRIFERFVLSQHPEMFYDIKNSLVKDAEWKEGIAVGMLVLAELGARWDTLLRRALYYIFEAGGLIPDIQPYAQSCVAHVALALGLGDAMALFQLFHPQIAFTWLEDQPLSSIPFKVFGYSNLWSLVQDAKQELVSQAFMRNLGDNMSELEKITETTSRELVRAAFSQAAAYAIAEDVHQMSRSKQASQGVSHAVESRMRELFPKQEYTELLKRHLTSIVGVLFTKLEQTDDLEKTFTGREDYTYANTALSYMIDISRSSQSLGESQQPSYKSKFLIDEIERLCRRVGTKPSSLWSPYLVCVTARMVFDDMNPVFGSSHLCRNIQRLRLLICFAGRTALQGYPIEMLLQGLRPFVTHPHCAEDSIGIYRYLLDHGKPNLARDPSFVVGTSISLFLSLRGFLESKQDSTTQGSQHKATLSKAHELHLWLGRYLDNMDFDTSGSSVATTMRSMVQAARAIVGQGTSRSQTAEAQLLLLLLGDSKPRNTVLRTRHLDFCLDLLCGDFAEPESFRTDVVSPDGVAVRYSSALWDLNRRNALSAPFASWIAKVLGRSFLHNGSIPNHLSRESTFKDLEYLWAGLASTVAPTIAICRILVDLMSSSLQQEVAVAEAVLKSILLSSSLNSEKLQIKDYIPNDLVVSLTAPGRNPSAVSTAYNAATIDLDDSVRSGKDKSTDEWSSILVLALAGLVKSDAVLGTLISKPEAVKLFSKQCFPFVLHLVLSHDKRSGIGRTEQISSAFSYMLQQDSAYPNVHVRALLNAFMYLRSQEMPAEVTSFSRNSWLNLDLEAAASAAMRCKLYKVALLLLDVRQTAESGRQTTGKDRTPSLNHILLTAAQQMDEPDAFYGVPQEASLDAVAQRLAYEGNEAQELLLRSAQTDSYSRAQHGMSLGVGASIISSMARLNMNTLTERLAATQPATAANDGVADSMLKAAMNLGKWDIVTSSSINTNISDSYRTFQALAHCESLQAGKNILNDGLSRLLDRTRHENISGQALRSTFSAFAALTETSELLSTNTDEDFGEIRTRFEKRQDWMETSQLEDVTRILAARATSLGILNQLGNLRAEMRIDREAIRLAEVSNFLSTAHIYRAQGSLPDALASVAYLADIVQPCSELGLEVSGAVKTEVSHVLWNRGELATSIKILQEVSSRSNLSQESIPVGKAGILATLGHHTSVARLERPNDIMHHYLRQAQQELNGKYKGEEAGQVFHEFASYCHRQLRNPEITEELRRSTIFVDRRRREVAELLEVAKGKGNDEQRQRAKGDRNKAKRWLEIDEVENHRLRRNREQYLRHCLENYMMALAASDKHDTNVLRFVALWLEHAGDRHANEPISKLLKRVPSHKFAPLMNQLASRLQDSVDDFQTSVTTLVERICKEHPYHAMSHVYAGSKTSGGNDRSGISRNAAAVKLAQKLQKDDQVGRLWSGLQKANDLYVDLAAFKSPSTKPGARLKLRSIPPASKMESAVPLLDVPPITLSINLRPDCNYSSVPTVKGFKPDASIAGGLSAPKVLTVFATDGLPYKQLFKSGSDDLRQDAIMEQVFEQVSNLLQHHRATRQRNLGIRTYKVIPLNANAGVIEFVRDTLPLNDFVKPAHGHYRQKDLRWDACRSRIDEHRTHSTEARLQVYQEIEGRFLPVLRHFFFERFYDPDEWFDRRLAYTRSTAAISILGHALGLGDRHCQNILLDEGTGEVVHIDLGVAFEAGRVLAVPELVPFRLTRDIVDGFGIMGTEGVFRRCCEFTLEALRNNKDAIMTLLNVLRYDPLYSWSMSPLRAKRLQEEQDKDLTDEAEPSTAVSSASRSMRNGAKVEQQAVQKHKEQEEAKQKDDESGGEADRALGVVEKKLAPELSVVATVNELIQQATDEKNLALLFCGWAAFA
ncbi:MAG: Serine/threonine-protein kinase tel1 [Chrysothrix sp. TS-e1954]|nr:MAG: Serine/threonine-protein kinase tel1 [Chrysothrix sp. TS-e1954]